MNADADPWQRLIDGLRSGDDRIAGEFWEQYGEPLQRFADKRLAASVRRRIGPEDVVQSACRTFLRRAKGGEFHMPDAEALWRLLCAITLSKVREQTRFHLRQKRGLDREQPLAVPAGESSAAGFETADPRPTPADAAEFADWFEKALAGLDEEEQQVVDLKLQELTNEEVADRLGSSERTVRRIVKRVQARLTRLLDDA
ncbi:MAG TPA: sigma-70 family RNA polymerase sigma factor [Gemmataceae bacterium]|nr:sigma-70 family RNA polymerase sigma factor [Gemmataceae bacterium]